MSNLQSQISEPSQFGISSGNVSSCNPPAGGVTAKEIKPITSYRTLKRELRKHEGLLRSLSDALLAEEMSSCVSTLGELGERVRKRGLDSLDEDEWLILLSAIRDFQRNCDSWYGVLEPLVEIEKAYVP